MARSALDAAADEHAAQENHDRHDRRGHEQEHQLLAVQLDFVKGVVLGVGGHNRRDFSTCAAQSRPSSSELGGQRLEDAPGVRSTPESSASARSASARAAERRPSPARYASASTACASAVSALQSEIFSASIASLHAAAAQMNPADQQMRLRLIRRQEQRPVELGERLAIVLLLDTAGGRDRDRSAPAPADRAGRSSPASLDPPRVRQLDVAASPARAPWAPARRPGRFSHSSIGRRQPPRQLLLARRLPSAAGGGQRGAEHEVRVAVGRIAAHRFAQPVDRRRRVALVPVGVAEIEEVVGLARIGFGRLVEVVRRQAGLRRRRRAAAGRRRGCSATSASAARRQRLERRERVVVPLQVELRQAGEKTRAPRPRRVGGNRRHRRERALVLALLVVDVPQRQPRAVERRLACSAAFR